MTVLNPELRVGQAIKSANDWLASTRINDQIIAMEAGAYENNADQAEPALAFDQVLAAGERGQRHGGELPTASNKKANAGHAQQN